MKPINYEGNKLLYCMLESIYLLRGLSLKFLLSHEVPSNFLVYYQLWLEILILSRLGRPCK